MASPLTFYISTKCRLHIELELDDGGADGSIESPTHRRTCRKYFVQNKREALHIRRSIEYDREYEGYLSPTHTVTLPKEVRIKGGVPLDAKYYAYLHPPIGLINDIDFNKYSAESPKSLDSDYRSYLDIIHVAINGGYVYFTNKYKVIRVNSISLNAISMNSKDKKTLKFSGPYEVNKDVCDEMLYLERPQGLPYELLHEAGFVALAWVRPCETFRSKSITDKLHHCSGAILYFRDDNSAAAYILNPAGHRDRDGDLGTVIDVIQASRKNLRISDFPRLTSPHKCTYSIKEWRDEIIHMDKTKTKNEAKTWSGSDKSNILKTIDDKRTLIHLACHAGLDLNLIKKLLSDESDSKFFNRLNLSYQDGRKWTPLHYACMFSPEKIDLIKYLIKKCPQATIIADKYGRYPLHIACDSKCSTEVIISLLEQNSSEQVLKATKGLKRLPLHIACQRCKSHCVSAIASDAINEAVSKVHVISETVADGSIQADTEGAIKLACIISALLEKDEEGKTVRAETEIGRLPLHTAIQMKLPPETIKLLLDKDKEWKSDIYGQFNGMIPLHIACWNNSSAETIQLLLDKDEDGDTTNIMIDGDASTSKKYCMVTKTSSLDLKGSLGLKNTLGAAIHLAAEHGSPDVVLYLIKKERESQYQIIRRNENGERYLKQPFLQDCDGKFPLHIACENNVNTSVIEMLLQEDPTKETFRTRDNHKRTPIHYLCENKEVKKETLEILINAEKQYVEREYAGQTKSVYKALDSDGPISEHSFRRSTWSIDDRQRSPLCLAIKAGVSEDVLEVLLRPESFYLKGLDGAATNELAIRINNLSTVRSTLQDLVIDRLADRSFVFVLLIDFYTNVFALVFYLRGSERLLNGCIELHEPVIISICVGFFLLREVVQIRSQYGQYLVDLWSWQQIACAGLLIASLKHMFQAVAEIKCGDFDKFIIKRNLLTITGAMLILQFIFFLRSTFLPFARFVGGVLLICKTLIPFFIVSFLILLAFAYSFLVINREKNECGNMEERNMEESLMEKCCTWEKCCYFVLQGFFSGPSSENMHVINVVFGIVAFLVLLHVVIAIVDKAWTSAADQSSQLYWNFRLEFLSEVRYFFIIKQYISVNKLEKLATLIDNVDTIRYINHADWSKKPYNRILKRENYIKPFEWFTPDLASEITSAHSLQGDLYWIKREEDDSDQIFHWDRVKVITKWMMSCFLYLILILLGILTAGLFWPKNFRKDVLSLGIEAEYTELEAAARRKAAELEAAVTAAASAKKIKEKND